MVLRKSSVPVFVFCMMLAVYSMFSTMLPGKLGVPEVIIGILLTLLVIGNGLSALLSSGYIHKTMFFLFLLFYPLLVGAYKGNFTVDMVRDVVPIFFLFLPVFMCKIIEKQPDLWIRVLSIGISIVGLCMMIRHFFGAEHDLTSVGDILFVGSGLVLPQDPALQFSASFLLFSGINLFFYRKYVFGALLILLSVLLIMSLLSIAARAPIFLIVLCLLFYLYRVLTLSMIFLALPAFIFISSVFIYVFYDEFYGSISMMLLKTENYGVLNHRNLEVAQVFDSLSYAFGGFFTGMGWGGLLSNPILDGLKTSFVHNSFVYYLFKGGLFSLLVYSLYILGFVRSLPRLLLSKQLSIFDMAAVVSLSVPLFINLFLEVAFKSLTFSLLLCLLMAITAKYATSERVVG